MAYEPVLEGSDRRLNQQYWKSNIGALSKRRRRAGKERRILMERTPPPERRIIMERTPPPEPRILKKTTPSTASSIGGMIADAALDAATPRPVAKKAVKPKKMAEVRPPKYGVRF